MAAGGADATSKALGQLRLTVAKGAGLLRPDAGTIAVEQTAIKARKSDTEVTDLALVWRPA